MIKNRDSQWKYGPKLKAMDIIEMKFDAGEGCLSYRVNDKDIELESIFNSSDDKNIAFNDILKRKDIKYRMAVGICQVKDSIKIISFSME